MNEDTEVGIWIDAIGKCGFFAGLDPEVLRKVEASAIVRQYAEGEVIAAKGEPAAGLYVIVRGRVRLSGQYAGSAAGPRELGPEECFAETALIGDKPLPVSFTASEDTECALVPKKEFRALMEEYPKLSIRLARALARRLDQSVGKQGLAGKSASVARAPLPVLISASPAASMKAGFQQKILDAFEQLYTVKAITRFSVAVLGCPVEGTADNLVDEIRLGDVKALIVPAGEPVEMAIEAYGSGSFTLHVFTPDSASPVRFDPVRIEPGDRFTLSLPGFSLTPVG